MGIEERTIAIAVSTRRIVVKVNGIINGRKTLSSLVSP